VSGFSYGVLLHCCCLVRAKTEASGVSLLAIATISAQSQNSNQNPPKNPESILSQIAIQLLWTRSPSLSLLSLPPLTAQFSIHAPLSLSAASTIPFIFQLFVVPLFSPPTPSPLIPFRYVSFSYSTPHISISCNS
jgi:hypothetical protein